MTSSNGVSHPLSELLLISVYGRKSGQAVLVHCKMGISRSSSTVIAYVMKQQRWPLDVVLAYVRDRRPIIKPNEGFMKQLQTYSGILSARSGTMLDKMSSWFSWPDFVTDFFWFSMSEFMQWSRFPHHSSQQRHSTLWRRKSREQRKKSVRKQVEGEEGKPNEEEEEEEDEGSDEDDEESPDDMGSSEEKDDSGEETQVNYGIYVRWAF